MPQIDKSAVEKILAEYSDRYTGKDMIAGKNVTNIQVDGARVAVDLQFGYPCNGIRQEVQSEVETRLLAVEGIDQAAVTSNTKVIARSVQHGVKSCLLYTSPSPRDGLLSRMPSSA